MAHSIDSIRSVCLLTALSLGIAFVPACRPKPVPEEILGAIDVPTPGRVLDGQAVVAGWALAKSGVDKISLYIDRQFVDFPSGGGNRPDIARLYPNYPGSANAAWSTTLDPEKMTDGPHEIIVQAKAKSGALRQFGPLPFKWRVSSRHAAKEIPLEPILGNLDAPQPGAMVRGSTVVGGWVIAETGVQRIALYVDGQFVRFEVAEEKRPDIAKMYPAFPGSSNAGWTTALDTSSMSDGEHQILAQVKTKSGAIRNLGPVTFRVVH